MNFITLSSSNSSFPVHIQAHEVISVSGCHYYRNGYEYEGAYVQCTHGVEHRVNETHTEVMKRIEQAVTTVEAVDL